MRFFTQGEQSPPSKADSPLHFLNDPYGQLRAILVKTDSPAKFARYGVTAFFLGADLSASPAERPRSAKPPHPPSRFSCILFLFVD